MALVTLCPGCGTTFRVNAAQLQIQSGDVRCGHCQRVFNGFATLITVNESDIEYPSRINDRPQSIQETEASSECHAATASLNNEMERSFSSDWNREAIETTDHLFDEEPPR